MSSTKKKGRAVRPRLLFQWLEEQDADLAGAFRDLSLENALVPGGRVAGVTLLYPADPAFRAEIVEMAYSDRADEAAELIETLILPEAVTRAADFKRGVGNRRGVLLECGATSARGAEFAGGLKVEQVADFAPAGRRPADVAVWRITEGRPPAEGAAYEPPAHEKKPKGSGGGGGGSGASAAAAASRAALAAATERDFDAGMRAGPGRARRDPYLGRAVSLLNFLRESRPEAYARVLPLVDYDPAVCFYLLLEPYKTAGEYLIATDDLVGPGAWNGADLYSDAVKEYLEHFRGAASGGASGGGSGGGGGGAATTATDQKKVAAAVDAIRKEIRKSGNVQQAPAAVRAAYETLSRENKIRDQTPVLPAATLAAVPAAKKLWQDELRFVVGLELRALRAAPYESATFAGVLARLRTERPGNDYEKETTITNLEWYKAQVAPRAAYIELVAFANSTDFLFTAPAPEAVGTWGATDFVSPQEPFNRNRAALDSLEGLRDMGRSGGLSERDKTTLRYLRSRNNGELPSFDD
jgi:hypothetical protein